MNRPGQLLPGCGSLSEEVALLSFPHCFSEDLSEGSFFSPRGTQNRFFGWLPEVSGCADGARVCRGPSPPPAPHPPWLPESQEEEVAGRCPGEVGLGWSETGFPSSPLSSRSEWLARPLETTGRLIPGCWRSRCKPGVSFPGT